MTLTVRHWWRLEIYREPVRNECLLYIYMYTCSWRFECWTAVLHLLPGIEDVLVNKLVPCRRFTVAQSFPILFLCAPHLWEVFDRFLCVVRRASVTPCCHLQLRGYYLHCSLHLFPYNRSTVVAYRQNNYENRIKDCML